MKEKGKKDRLVSKQGELLPVTEEEYRPWIKGKIAEAVALGNFEGINPDAANGLRDDVIAWLFIMGENKPSDKEAVPFLKWIQNGLDTLPSDTSSTKNQLHRFMLQDEIKNLLNK